MFLDSGIEEGQGRGCLGDRTRSSLESLRFRFVSSRPSVCMEPGLSRLTAQCLVPEAAVWEPSSAPVASFFIRPDRPQCQGRQGCSCLSVVRFLDGRAPGFRRTPDRVASSIQGSQLKVDFRYTRNNFLPYVFAWDFLKLKCHSLFIQM